MQEKRSYSTYRAAALSISLAASLAGLTGCGVTAADVSAPVKVAGTAFQGSVHGGQQPVSGSSIQLYAANSAGYASGSFALLNTPVASDATGSFSITGDYTCPSASTPVYITATGGNPGLTGNNSNLAMMAAIGPCGNLSPASFININELTTVASIYPLAPFMGSAAAVGSSATNAQGITNAFATVNNLANISTGTIPGPTLPAGGVLPTAELNTLADIIASCINSAGLTSTGDTTSSCGKLFTYTTPTGGTAPTDTIAALLNIAKYPSNNVTNLIALTTPAAPFQPTLASAKDFTVSIKYTAGLGIAPSAVAVDGNGRLWIPNASSSSITVFNAQGAPITGSPFTNSAFGTISSIAIDASGNAWAPNYSSRLFSITPAGVSTQQSVTIGSGAQGISIDGQGVLWITGSSQNNVTAVTTSGASATGATTYSTGSLSGPVAVAINPH